jgi:hypothetical protein
MFAYKPFFAFAMIRSVFSVVDECFSTATARIKFWFYAQVTALNLFHQRIDSIVRGEG